MRRRFGIQLLSSRAMPATCGDRKPHASHLDVHMNRDCPGLSMEEAAVTALIGLVEQYVRDLGPFPVLPEGIRLEMHPSVRHAIMRHWMPDYRDFVSDGEPKPFPPQIPVKVTTDLERGAWRLVVVKEDVINGGVMPDPVAWKP